MLFGKRLPAAEAKAMPFEAPKELATEMVWNLGLGLFCLLAVLFLGQVGKLLMYIGGKLSNAMVRGRALGDKIDG